jgi:hypothetical protein
MYMLGGFCGMDGKKEQKTKKMKKHRNCDGDGVAARPANILYDCGLETCIMTQTARNCSFHSARE